MQTRIQRNLAAVKHDDLVAQSRFVLRRQMIRHSAAAPVGRWQSIVGSRAVGSLVARRGREDARIVYRAAARRPRQLLMLRGPAGDLVVDRVFGRPLMLHRSGCRIPQRQVIAPGPRRGDVLVGIAEEHRQDVARKCCVASTVDLPARTGR